MVYSVGDRNTLVCASTIKDCTSHTATAMLEIMAIH